jgi:hypothetical protein
MFAVVGRDAAFAGVMEEAADLCALVQRRIALADSEP